MFETIQLRECLEGFITERQHAHHHPDLESRDGMKLLEIHAEPRVHVTVYKQQLIHSRTRQDLDLVVQWEFGLWPEIEFDDVQLDERHQEMHRRYVVDAKRMEGRLKQVMDFVMDIIYDSCDCIFLTKTRVFNERVERSIIAFGKENWITVRNIWWPVGTYHDHDEVIVYIERGKWYERSHLANWVRENEEVHVLKLASGLSCCSKGSLIQNKRAFSNIRWLPSDVVQKILANVKVPPITEERFLEMAEEYSRSMSRSHRRTPLQLSNNCVDVISRFALFVLTNAVHDVGKLFGTLYDMGNVLGTWLGGAE